MTKLISTHNKKVLSRFKDMSYVETCEERKILEIYGAIGFVQFRFDWDKMNETAKLTDSGIKHLNR